jgi:hypothetical protein
VGTLTKLDLWKGFVTEWSFDAGPEFRLQASDGSTNSTAAIRTACLTAGRLHCSDQPVNVGGKKGVPRISPLRSPTRAYGQPVGHLLRPAEDDPLSCREIIAGRDESEFYTALG